MAECTKDERELLDVLKKASVVTPSPYETTKGELQIYRMRLFSARERAALRGAIRCDNGWECAEGCAGMMDELEVVRLEVHGKRVKDLARTI